MLVLGLAACEKEYDRPPLNEPVYEGETPNITIAEFREQFKGATQDAPITIEEDLVLKATVISSDESGNIYQTMYIQDETGGIAMIVAQNDTYTTYRVGQEVYIHLQGMCASFYGDLQIGFPTGYLYRTPWEDFQEHVLKDKWPNPEAVSIREISDLSSLNEDSDSKKATLVRLTGVHFEDGGKETFGDLVADETVNRTLKDAQGNSIVVRTSNYATFAGEVMPVGTGNIVGILGNFNGTWQLLIRDIADVYGFDGVPVDDGGSTGGDVTGETIFEESFATDQGDFTINNVTLPEGSSYVWRWAEYNGNAYMNASAYVGGQNKAAESWLVSPEIDLTGCTSATLTFEHAQRFASNPEDELMVYIAPSGTSVGASAWQKVAVSNYSDGSNWTFVPAEANLSALAGQKMQFAFRYVSSTSSAPGWEIKNVKVVAGGSGGGSTGGEDESPDFSI